MLNRDDNHQCSWCGKPINPARGKTAPDCCSKSCARDYADDRGHPIEWEQYLQTTTVCSACGVRPVGHPKHRWCTACKDAWKATHPPVDTPQREREGSP